MALTGNDEEKFQKLCAKNYKDQSIWFLNAYWHKFGQSEAEKIWAYKHRCDEYDLQNRAAGSALDELNAHRFLESFKAPLTVREMREAIRASGAVKDAKFTNVPLTHFLVTLYKVNYKELVNASQGDNKEEIERAQKMLDAVMKAFEETERKSAAAKAALREAESREADSRNKEKEAKTREAESIAAKKELETALAELKAQEDAYNARTEDLKSKSEAGSVVAANKAKAELAQHLNTPTLPLQRAKITQEAAVKKADRARQAAADARAAAEQAVAKAVEARKESERAKAAAERAVDDARQKVQEAEDFLQEVKSKPGNAQGAIWWLERELHEAKAFLPERKGGYKKDREAAAQVTAEI